MTECELQGHSHLVKSVAFSYDERHVVSESYDGTVRIWDCQTEQEICLYQHSANVSSVAWSRERVVLLLDRTKYFGCGTHQQVR